MKSKNLLFTLAIVWNVLCLGVYAFGKLIAGPMP